MLRAISWKKRLLDLFVGPSLRQRVCLTSSSKAILSTEFPEVSHWPGVRSFEDLYKLSILQKDVFWGTVAQSRLLWRKPFDKVSECNMKEGKIAWFLGGKLNVSENCVDRHLATKGSQTALIWEKDEPGTEEKVTYRELHALVCQMANMLRSHGVSKGHRVAIYMPVSPLSVAAMLACARIGAVHSVVFAGFSADALAIRIADAQAETVITADQGLRGGKVIELKRTVDAAVEKCPSVRQVFVMQRTGGSVPMGKKDILLERAMSRESSECLAESMGSEDPLFLLYTSGSTGKPKGVLHTQAGYLLYASLTHKLVFDYRDGDLFGCVADIGWITGHSYVVYGPLANGASTLLFESVPTYPDPARYWSMVSRLRVTQFYTAPTALRLLLRYGDSWVQQHDRSSIRTLGSVGEPLNHEAWEWYHRVVGEGRCDIIDTWWQTETGGCCIAPRPSAPNAEIKPAMPMRPFLGIEPVLVDERGKPLEGNDVSGALCIRHPWPGMARTIYGDHDKFFTTYFEPFPGLYCSGDGATRDTSGYYHITGRLDDVINVSGHRLGTAEIEDELDDHALVAETAVVGFPHDIKGEGIYAFVVLREGATMDERKLDAELKALVRKKIAAYAVPDAIHICSGLPKTRSGKIMRRILRKLAAGQVTELGDISTLADPSVVQTLINAVKAKRGQ